MMIKKYWMSAVTLFIALVVLAVFFTLVSYGIYNSLYPSKIYPAVLSTESSSLGKQAVTPTVNAVIKSPRALPRAVPDYSDQWTMYNKLQDLCNQWTRWFNRDHDETSRLNMNVSCRDANQYARRELHRDMGVANHVAGVIRDNPKSQVLVAAKSVAKRDTALCQSLESQLKLIQSQLRAGYSEPRGNYLRAHRRDIAQSINDNCR